MADIHFTDTDITGIHLTGHVNLDDHLDGDEYGKVFFSARALVLAN